MSTLTLAAVQLGVVAAVALLVMGVGWLIDLFAGAYDPDSTSLSGRTPSTTPRSTVSDMSRAPWWRQDPFLAQDRGDAA